MGQIRFTKLAHCYWAPVYPEKQIVTLTLPFRQYPLQVLESSPLRVKCRARSGVF